VSICLGRSESPSTVARVETLVARRHLPGATNALEAPKAKGHSRRVQFAILAARC
jgi:hypothetical protein